MPAPLRSAGCLLVVAMLLPPGTALMRPRFARKIGCNRRNLLPRVLIVPKAGTISTKKAVFVLIVPKVGTICTFLILVDSDWSLSLKKVDSGLTLLLV